MKRSVLLLMWCMIGSSNKTWTLRIQTDRVNTRQHVLSKDQLINFKPSSPNEFNKLLVSDSFEQEDLQKKPSFKNEGGFNIHGFHRFYPIHRFHPTVNQILSFNPNRWNHRSLTPFYHPIFQSLRPPNLADGFDPNLHEGLHPTRKQDKRPFFHIGFLPNRTPQLFSGSGKDKSDENTDIIHSEIHDINNDSLGSHEFHDFRYEGSLGPQFWSELYTTCNGTHQSPIAIYRINTTRANFGNFMSRNYYTVPYNGTITNNGHTAMVTLPGGTTVSGGGLPGVFEFLNFHFHWGSDDHRGSEHVLEGVRYPLELHMVHWNLKYESADEALHHLDGIAVLAVLFHVEPLDNPYLVPLIEALKQVVPSCTNMTFAPNFRLSDFLPIDTRDFYRYKGSLTTPECSESVIWTIFANTLSISEGQLNVFRTLLDADNHDRENNHRPVQPLNNRIIYRNVK